MKTTSFRLLLEAAAGLSLAVGMAWGTCGGDEYVAGEWIFEPVAEMPGWALNSGTDEDVGNLGLTGGAAFSTNVPPMNCDCGHSLLLPGTNGVVGAVSINDYDPLAGSEKFSILAWVKRNSADGANLSARIFSDTDSTALTNTTSGVEFRFSGNAGNLALRINGTEVSSTVGGIAPTNGEWHHVAVVYDGTRAATNYATRNVHFYVDGIQRGVGSVLQNAVVATNYAPVVVGNASPLRTAANLMAGNIDDVLVVPGWAPDAVGNGNANAAIQCFMNSADDIFPPSIIAPTDVEAEAGECLAPVAVALGTPTVGDDCMVAAVTNDAPGTFPLGTNVVTWTVFDEAGNSSNSVQIVTVVPSRTGDCDEDGLTDYEEVVTHGTDWNCADTDGDGLNDGDEVDLETSPFLPDTDGDGWTDGEEVLDAGTDPLDPFSAPRLARGVLLHAVKYSAGADSQWVQLHCSGPREVDISGFRIQVAGTNWETQVTFPSNTWMVPGHFLLVGGTNIPNADIEADFDLPGSYSSLPTAGIRLMAPENSTNAPVDVLMYGSHVPFNEQGLDTTGWLSETTNLWASSTRHLERWEFGRDTDREGNWHHVADGTNIENAGTVLDTDGDGLTDEQEYTGARNDGDPTDPLNLDSDGDGLWDGFEIRNGLDPQATHSGGSVTSDYDTINPETGNTFGQDQLAAGVEVSWSASKSDWTMGGSIGSNGWVRFEITASDGGAIWASIAEGGHTSEAFTYSVGDATILYESTRTVGGFTRLYLLLQPTLGSGTCALEIDDNSAGSGVTDPDQVGADISAAFQAARLNISMPHTDETTEESPGEFIPDSSVHTNAPRTALTIGACELGGFPGQLQLDWAGSSMSIYSSVYGGAPLPYYRVPASGFEGTTLYVEGHMPGTGNLQWKSVEVPDLTDEISITVVSVSLYTVTPSACDGWSINIDVVTEPNTAQNHLSSVQLTIGKPDNNTFFDNPAHQGSTIVARGNHITEWCVPNMRWYSTAATHCNQTAPYKIMGSCRLDDIEIELIPLWIQVGAGRNCVNGYAFTTQHWAGDIDFLSAELMPNMYQVWVLQSTFRRDVHASYSLSVAENSQFYDMGLQEEIFHVGQFEGTTSTLCDNLWNVLQVMNDVTSNQLYTGITEEIATRRAREAFVEAQAREEEFASECLRSGSSLRCQLEGEAKAAVNATHILRMPCAYPDCSLFHQQ